jgi:ribosome-associated translation inhibitor RaiA
MTTEEIREVEVSLGNLPVDDVTRYAEGKIRTLGRYAAEPVLHARVRLVYHPDPAVARRFIARGSLDVNGRPVHAQVESTSANGAVDLLHDVLRRRLQRMARSWGGLRGTRAVQRQHEHPHPLPPAEQEDG